MWSGELCLQLPGKCSALWAPPGPRDWSFWDLTTELPGLRFKPRPPVMEFLPKPFLYALIPLLTLFSQTIPEERENKHY